MEKNNNQENKNRSKEKECKIKKRNCNNILPIFAIAISLCALFCPYFKQEPNLEITSVLVTVLAILVTVLIAWQIYNSVEINKKVALFDIELQKQKQDFDTKIKYILSNIDNKVSSQINLFLDILENSKNIDNAKPTLEAIKVFIKKVDFFSEFEISIEQQISFENRIKRLPKEIRDLEEINALYKKIYETMRFDCDIESIRKRYENPNS